MRKKLILISIGLSLILMGCGSNSKSNNEKKTESKNSISVPQNISMMMPKALRGESGADASRFEKRNKKDSSDSQDVNMNISRGYMALKGDIEQVESMKMELQINLLLADKIMPKIEEECQDIPLGTTCMIESGQLSFILDKEMMNEISNITGEEIPSEASAEIENREIKLGETSFIQYASSEDYQYVLVMDMSTIENGFNSKKVESTQTIKWSKDENHIWSMYDMKEKNMELSMVLRYLKKSNGQIEMEVNDKFEETFSMDLDDINTETIKGEFNFKISNLNDDYKITSSSIDYNGDTQMGSSISVGEISDNKGGYLNFKGIFDGNEYREKEQFNAKGEVIFSGYCDSLQECDLNDESTWLEYGDDTINLPFESDFVSLSVTGGDLNEGQYLLLAPNSIIEDLGTEEIFSASIGEIYVIENEIYGMLNSKDYLDKLDELVIVYLNMKFDETQPLLEPTFEIVPESKRPILKEES